MTVRAKTHVPVSSLVSLSLPLTAYVPGEIYWPPDLSGGGNYDVCGVPRYCFGVGDGTGAVGHGALATVAVAISYGRRVWAPLDQGDRDRGRRR